MSTRNSKLETRNFLVTPSRATTLKYGFAQVANFFPGTKVLAFTLYVVGEGIEKRADDFAAEVAAQVAAAKGQ